MPAQKIAIPKLFISSTVEDLQNYRLSIRDAALRTSFQPMMLEYFEAASDYQPYEACMQKVDETDLLVVIVAYRYGWIPEDQPGKLRKSITWLECERAREKGKSVLAFLVDEKHNWPVELKDSYQFMQKAGNVTPDLVEKINEKVKQLENFKNYLKSLGICQFFTNPDNLEKQVIQALQNWREKHADKVEQVAVAADERAYLKWLNLECAYIDIRGLQERSARAHKFGIE
ncbi:DUF4062 domain-containing protein, partial [candidate division KSB1 bacterium]|nr:DUF4062 domain-containing protein [candidate division KSB1 bacterium]